MRERKFLFSIILLIFFISAQSQSIIHDAKHNFHEHTIECDIYTFSNLSENSFVSELPLINFGLFKNQSLQKATYEPLLKVKHLFRARAPPALS